MDNDSGQFSRTELLLGKNSTKKLANSRVAIFGIGGVGGHCLEALARAGIGSFALIDHDTICLSNLNRQIIATHSSLGRLKVDVAAERVLDINPSAKVARFPLFYCPSNAGESSFCEESDASGLSRTNIDLAQYDYIIDAIDTVSGKIALVENATRLDIPIISCMGAGNKLDPLAFRIDDISKTTMCSLARVMRRELKKRGISHLKVVYSTEPPLTPNSASAESGQNTDDDETNCTSHGGRRQTPGSCSFIPSVAGLILASEVIKDLLKD